MKPILDNFGRPIGFLENQIDGTIRVYDSQMSYQGFAKPGQGTFDAQNRRISPDSIPSLLLRARN